MLQVDGIGADFVFGGFFKGPFVRGVVTHTPPHRRDAHFWCVGQACGVTFGARANSPFCGWAARLQHTKVHTQSESVESNTTPYTYDTSCLFLGLLVSKMCDPKSLCSI